MSKNGLILFRGVFPWDRFWLNLLYRVVLTMQPNKDYKSADFILCTNSSTFTNLFSTHNIEKKKNVCTVTSDGTLALSSIQTSSETNKQIDSENVDPDRDLVEKTNNLRKSLGLKPWKINENQAKKSNTTVHKKQQKFKCSDCD